MKHAVEPKITVIFEVEAALVIVRAMSKFAAVYKDVPTEWQEGLDWTVTRGLWKPNTAMDQ
jgi:hypothetical protein